MAKSKANIVKFFHSDAGHGWLAVKTRELVDLGVADKITAFSYTKGKTLICLLTLTHKRIVALR
jgi:hypothetical protein